jgi:hypothetical protein
MQESNAKLPSFSRFAHMGFGLHGVHQPEQVNEEMSFTRWFHSLSSCQRKSFSSPLTIYNRLAIGKLDILSTC